MTAWATVALALIAASGEPAPGRVSRPRARAPSEEDLRVERWISTAYNLNGFYDFTSDGALLIEGSLPDGSTELFAVDLASPQSKRTIARFDGAVSSANCQSRDLSRCVAVEEAYGWSRVWWIEPGRPRVLLRGPWHGNASVFQRSISTDGRFVAVLGRSYVASRGATAFDAMYLLDRSTGRVRSVHRAEGWLEPVEWAGEGDGARVRVSESGNESGYAVPPSYWVHVRTGRIQVAHAGEPSDRGYQPSPDGRVKVWLRDDGVLRVLDVKRNVVDTLVLDETTENALLEQGPLCWASPDWVLLAVEPAVVANVRQLELVALDAGSPYVIRELSPDGRNVLATDADGALFIGRLRLP